MTGTERQNMDPTLKAGEGIIVVFCSINIEKLPDIRCALVLFGFHFCLR